MQLRERESTFGLGDGTFLAQWVQINQQKNKNKNKKTYRSEWCSWRKAGGQASVDVGGGGWFCQAQGWSGGWRCWWRRVFLSSLARMESLRIWDWEFGESESFGLRERVRMISGKSENLIRGMTKKTEGNYGAGNLKVYSDGLAHNYN